MLMKSLESASNERLVREIGSGDQRSFAVLYRRLRPTMLRYAAGILAGDVAAAEDAVDEAFTDIWRRAASYTANGSAEGWIRRIVRNKAVDWLRKYGNGTISCRETDRDIVEMESSDPSPLDEALVKDESKWLRSALSRLSAEHREAVWLCYYERLPLAKIAAITCVPENTVKTRLFHARKLLSRTLERSSVRLAS